MKKEIQSIYALKAFCAFFVVCLHVLFWGRSIIVPIIYIAVPCFYLISGYFMVDNLGHVEKKHVKKQLVKLLWVTIRLNVVYFFIRLLTDCSLLIQLENCEYWIRGILFGDLFSGHLWFLTAYIEVLVLLLLIFRFKETLAVNAKMLILAFCLLVLALLLGRYSIIFGRAFRFDYYCNVFTSAIPFTIIGAFIRKNEHLLSAVLTTRKFLCIISLILILAYSEFLAQYIFPSIKSGGALNIFTIPLSVAFFCGCILCKDIKLNNQIVEIGRLYSSDIYFYHMAFVLLFWHYFKVFMTSNYFFTPILIFSLCIILSKVIIKCNCLFNKFKVWDRPDGFNVRMCNSLERRNQSENKNQS